MFISHQTYQGLKITVYSLIEITKFLLSAGMKFVLSEKFCQDALEEYFGHQRARRATVTTQLSKALGTMI